MKNYSVKFTKTQCYVTSDSMYWKGPKMGNLSPVLLSELNNDQRSSVESQYGWTNVGECVSEVEAKEKYVAIMREAGKEAKQRSVEFAQKLEAERKDAWEAIKDLEKIPATLENIRTLLLHLNSTNWGGWKLPALTINYTAHQYDCDGKQATTIILDKPVNAFKRYVVGAPRNHLSNYQRL